MPIKPENRGRYPKNWREIRARILERAADRCETCRIPNGAYRNRETDAVTFNEMQAETWSTCDGARVTRIVLTVAHLNHTPEDCRPENLRALCQRCHLAYDQTHHQRNARTTRRAPKALADLFE